jgi:hypothetical protein
MAAAGVVFVMMVGVVTVASVVIARIFVVAIVVATVTARRLAGDEVIAPDVNGHDYGYRLNGINATGQRRYGGGQGPCWDYCGRQ